jgi:hypothetical protein
MNCRSGDIAIIRDGYSKGKLVEVLGRSEYGPAWWAVRTMGGMLAGRAPEGVRAMESGHIEDSRLIPIRFEPGQDESLTWAGVPNGRAA